MRYLHTMVRVHDIDASLNFYCNLLGMTEISRKDLPGANATLIFLAAPEDEQAARENRAPMIELTYNHPDENGNVEEYDNGRNFGHLAYVVDDIYATCQKLMDGGVTINRPPRDGGMAFVKSPDGVSIELLQKGQSLAKQEPWASMENTGSW